MYLYILRIHERTQNYIKELKMLVLLKVCSKCNGDLVPDEDELLCFQCGERLYPKPQYVVFAQNFPFGRKVGSPNKSPYSGSEKDNRWKKKNEEKLKMLKEGASTKLVAEAFGVSERAIRVSRERMRDLDY